MPSLESLEEQIKELNEQNRIFAKALIELNKKIEARDFEVAEKVYPVFEQDSKAVIIDSTVPAVDDIAVEIPSSPAKEANSGSEKGFEEKIGTSIFSRLGILALVIGVGFFIKYVSDNNLIGHVGRILIGLTAGVGLIIAGKISSLREKYANWGKVLIGGGLAITYFVIYAAYAFPDYRAATGMSQSLDVILLVLTAGFAVFLSVKDNSKLIAAEAFLLGFLTCLLNRDFGNMVLVYDLILTAALIFVAAYKKWPVFGIAGAVATYASYSLWRMENPHANVLAMSFLAIFFLAYVLQSIVFSKNSAQDEKLEKTILAANVINSLFFFVCGLLVSREWRGDYDALFCALFATFHLVAFWAAFGLGKKLTAWVYFYFGISSLAIAVPLWLDREMITIVWSALSLTLLLSSLKARLPHFKYAAHGLFALTLIKVLFIDSSLAPFSSKDIFDSTRIMAFVISAVFFAVAYVFLSLWRNKEASDKSASTLLYFYAAIPPFLLLLLTVLELSHLNDWNLFNPLLGLLFIPLCVLPFSPVFREMRHHAPVLGCLLFAKILFYDFLKSINNSGYDSDRLSNCIFTFLLLAAAGLFWKYFHSKLESDVKAAPNIYGWLAVFVVFLSIAIELTGYSISVGWAILALLLISIGFIFRSKNFRYQGIVILALTLIKVLLYDTSELETAYRMISYISLGVILLGASFLYNKYKDKIV